MKTVWIYVDTNHDVGHPDHLKVFATLKSPTSGSRRTTLKPSPLDTRS